MTPTAGRLGERLLSVGDSVASGPETTLLRWRSSLLQRKPRKFAFGVLAAIFGLAVLWFGFRHDPGVVGVLVLAIVLTLGALGPAFFPVAYTLTTRRVYQRVFFSQDGHRWQDFDEYFPVEDGVFLHLRPTDLRQRYLKGLTLYFGRGNRDEILDVVRQRLATGRTGEGPAEGPGG